MEVRRFVSQAMATAERALLVLMGGRSFAKATLVY